MFRVKFYFKVSHFADDTVTMTTETRDTQAEADALFSQLQTAMGHSLTGGHVEQHVPGIGWVLADEVETVQILARRREEEPSIFNIAGHVFGGLGNVSNGL